MFTEVKTSLGQERRDGLIEVCERVAMINVYPSINDEQKRILAEVRQFALEYLTHENIRKWERDQSLPPHVMKKYVELDISLMDYIINPQAEKRGLYTVCLINEELARCAGATLPFLTDLLDIHVLSKFATQDHLDRLLAEFQKTGRSSFCFAVTEPETGSDVRSMSTYVETIEGVKTLNGCKSYVNNGEFTPFIMVIALDKDKQKAEGGRPLTAWLVPYDLEGVRTYPIPKRGQKLVPFSEIVFENVKLPDWCLLAPDGLSYADLNDCFQFGRMGACASSLGMAQAAMDDAMKYVASRKAFGKGIGDFQQIQLMLVEMELKLRNMRCALYVTARHIDEGNPVSRLEMAMAKYYITKTAVEVADSAMQIFGARGYSEKERIARIWEDCRGNQIAEGTSQIMVTIAAKELFKRYADE